MKHHLCNKCGKHFEYYNMYIHNNIKTCNNCYNIHSSQNYKNIENIENIENIKNIKGIKGIKNVNGKRGDKGTKGISGIDGIFGIKGMIGDKGTIGEKGTTGLKGILGSKGETGDNGIYGSNGLKGINGLIGMIGSSGDKGILGMNGDTGENGDKGSKGMDGGVGMKGEIGITGFVGMNGVYGELGTKGNDGAKGWTGINGLIGEKGENGINGEKGINGTNGINGLQGIKGIKGSIGINGSKGENGSNGVDGINGVKGPDGATGDPGTNGIDGTNGTNGINGTNGATGEQGIDGSKGITGNDGINGIVGATGDSGSMGDAGSSGINGTNGTNGEKGLPGMNGLKGDNGIDGQTGENGVVGATGNKGEPGTNGATGPVGMTGIGGIKGAIGEKGIDGINGETGDSGINGMNGVTGDSGMKGEIGDTGPYPELIEGSELIFDYTVDNPGLIHPVNARYIEFSLVGGGGGGGIATLFTQLGSDIAGDAAGDSTGYSVSINTDGNIIAIGAIGADGNGSASGRTRIYQYVGTNWVKLGQDIDGAAGSDQSGFSVSINGAGNIVAIGSPYNDASGNNSGHTRIYQYNGTIWVKLGQDIGGEAASDESGTVSINNSGNIVAIGSNRNNGFVGHVRIYSYNGTNWVQLGSDIDGIGAANLFAYSISINAIGNIVAIGAHQKNSNRGQTQIFKYDGVSWNQLGPNIDGLNVTEITGYSVSISSNGHRVAIGGPGMYTFGTSNGLARIYEYNDIGISWDQLGSDIVGDTADDSLGFFISINSDGNIVVIGAKQSLSDNGYAKIYKYDGAQWNQIGQTLVGEAIDDRFGWSVSINGPGDIVGIGATRNNGIGDARIFKLKNGAGNSGKKKYIKRKLPNSFSFVVGNGGNPLDPGTDTILNIGSGPIETITAFGGGGGCRNSIDGGPGYYNGYGAGGGNINGSGGSNKAVDGTSIIGGSGASGFVRVTYS
jgi:hypothetical protein